MFVQDAITEWGLAALNLNIRLCPIGAVEVRTGRGGTVQIFKTAGLHLHRGRGRRGEDGNAVQFTEAYKSRIARSFQLLYNVMSENNKRRMKLPVIGPTSGNPYRYSTIGNSWRNSRDGDHLEFRAFPSSEIAINERALELAYRFCNPDLAELKEEELHELVGYMNTEVVIPFADLVECKPKSVATFSVVTAGDLRFLKKTGSVDLSVPSEGELALVLCDPNDDKIPERAGKIHIIKCKDAKITSLKGLVPIGAKMSTTILAHTTPPLGRVETSPLCDVEEYAAIRRPSATKSYKGKIHGAIRAGGANRNV